MKIKLSPAWLVSEEDNNPYNIKTREIIKKFDMESFMHQRIDTLSTGQYQRTSISRCVVHDPKYYIFDEATSGLDIISSKIILDFIKSEYIKGLETTIKSKEAKINLEKKLKIVVYPKALHSGKIINPMELYSKN